MICGLKKASGELREEHDRLQADLDETRTAKSSLEESLKSAEGKVQDLEKESEELKQLQSAHPVCILGMAAYGFPPSLCNLS